MMETETEFVHETIGDLVRRGAERVPDRTALIVPASIDGCPEQRWTYRELLEETHRSARALLKRFSPGDHVATWAGSGSEVLFLHLGAAVAGIVLVTLNPAVREAELEYLLSQSGARGIFLDRQFRGTSHEEIIGRLRSRLPQLEEVVFIDEWDAYVADTGPATAPVVAPDAVAMILFTSGTTGKPKGAILLHEGLVNNARLSTQRLELQEGSVWLNVLPLFHVGGSVTMTLGCISNLGTQVLLPAFSAEGMLDALQNYRVNLTMAVPTMLTAVLEAPGFGSADLSFLEVVVTGGTVVAPGLVKEVNAGFGAEVMVLFGQTEAGGCMCLTHRGDDMERITNSVGAPLPLSETRIVSTDRKQVLSAGEMGEICVRTRCAMREYFRMPEKTREALDADGWLYTGDLGVMRRDGYLQVTGRLKDMIIRGGENIYPREIEDALAGHSAVSQSAVFGLPDTKWGEQVAAAVVLRPGADADAGVLEAFLTQRLARHKVPRIWSFEEQLPVNASGKVQKFVLRDRLLSGTDRVSGRA